MRLDSLFEAELSYNSQETVVIPADDREGELIGSGGGRVTGSRITGTIRWSFYAVDCAYLLVKAGVNPGPGQYLCRANPGGVIETDDGTVIRFDAKGLRPTGIRSLGTAPVAPYRCAAVRHNRQ